jgi:hypothetical protein
MEALGAVGAIVGLIDVATRSILALADLRRQFKDADMTITLLSGQIIAVRSALTQIQTLWSPDRESYYLSVLNLDISLKCCELLLEKLDEQLQHVNRREDEDHATFTKRARVVLESKGTEECLTRLDRQINALNLMVTTLNW